MVNNNEDLEMVVLGCFLIDDKCTHYIKVISPKMLVSVRHKAILNIMHEMISKDMPIDLLTVAQYARKIERINEVGGTSYLSELTNRVASSANIEHYILFLKNKWMQNEITSTIMFLCAQETNTALDLSDQIKLKLDELEAEFRDGFSYNYLPQNELYTKAIEHISDAKDRSDNGTPKHGKATNIPELDALIGNLQQGELIIIGARPAMGKTMTMLQMAQNTSEYPVIIFSLEMSSRSLMIRQISRECEIEYRDLQTGNFRQSINELIAKSEFLTKNKIIVDDTSAMSCAQLERVCKIIHKTYGGIAAVFVDYLDIVENHEKELRHKVSYTARTLKRLAKDLNTPVVCLAQLSREVAKRTDKRPILSDIRESGKVEEEADLILFLHRPGYYDSEALDEMGNDASDLLEIIAAKNRNGNLGTAKTRIDLKYGKFTALREFNHTTEFYNAPHNNDLF